jgi:DNA-binding transcriptional MerR regulator
VKTKEGKSYRTIDDAARELGVNIDTLRRWFKKGFLPTPPRVFFGTVGVQVFSDEYLEAALKILADHRSRNEKSLPTASSGQ